MHHQVNQKEIRGEEYKELELKYQDRDFEEEKERNYDRDAFPPIFIGRFGTSQSYNSSNNIDL